MAWVSRTTARSSCDVAHRRSRWNWSSREPTGCSACLACGPNGRAPGWPGLFVSTQVEAPFAESFDGAVTHLLILHLDGPVAVGRRVGGANLRRRVPAGGLFLHPAGQNLTVELGGELNSVHIYLAEETTPVTRILAEIRQQGYTGSANLLVRYINQGRADPQRVVPSPRRLVSWIMSRPTELPEDTRRHLHDLIASCPRDDHAGRTGAQFAAILTQRRGQVLAAWIAQTRLAALPGFGSYLNGLDQDAAVAGLTLPYSNGPTEGVNTKVKMLKRQTYGRASSPCYARESYWSNDHPSHP
jgi:hypothetical protein